MFLGEYLIAGIPNIWLGIPASHKNKLEPRLAGYFPLFTKANTPDSSGIDIGGSEHWVAISPDRDENPVQRFDCFTSDLERMAKWLLDKGVRSVAMQST